MNSSICGVVRCLSPLPPKYRKRQFLRELSPRPLFSPSSFRSGGFESGMQTLCLYWTSLLRPVQFLTPLLKICTAMDDSDLYRIGTVSKLTGISPECLRAWERRYGLAPTHRNGRTRYYDRDQIKKLTKIKALIEQGHPISSLASLSMEQLKVRLSSPMQAISSGRLPLVGLIGTSLLLLEQQHGDAEQVEIAHRWVSVEDFLNSRPSERAHLDVLAIYSSSLKPEDLERAMEAAPGVRAIALYQFALPGTLEQVTQRGVQVLNWPVTWSQLSAACAAPGASVRNPGKASPRRYSDHELLALAQDARQHGLAEAGYLVDLITQMNGFAEYLTQAITAAADETGLKDRVREQTCYARAQLEQALQDVSEMVRNPNSSVLSQHSK